MSAIEVPRTAYGRFAVLGGVLSFQNLLCEGARHKRAQAKIYCFVGIFIAHDERYLWTVVCDLLSRENGTPLSFETFRSWIRPTRGHASGK